MSRRLFVWLDGQADGPFEEVDIRERVANGVLSQSALAKAEFDGPRGWEPVGELLAKRDRVDAMLARPTVLVPPTRKGDPANRLLRLGAIVVGALMVFVVMVHSVTKDGPNWNREPSRYEAYAAARDFAFAQLPGAKDIASASDSVVEREGRTYRVGFRVDGLNAFGGPVRRTVAVEMEHDGSSFRFVRLIQ